MNSIGLAWLQFGVCAALIAFAGARLSRYGDIIAEKTGLSGSWIGLVLLATVTSLPELVVGATSVTVADAPNIAIGDLLGSCVFNLAALIVLDFLHHDQSIYRRASQGHILSAAFGIVLIGFVGANLLLGDRAARFALWHVGAYAPIIALVYLLAVRMQFNYERRQIEEFVQRAAGRYPGISLRGALSRYALWSLVVLASGTSLTFAAARLSDLMGWSSTFVGSLLVAGATSLPELSVTVAAMRIGAVDMAVANLLGSNLTDMLFVVIDDLLLVDGPILSVVSPLHAISAMSAVVMNGIVIVGLLYRAETRLFRTVGWISIALTTVYLLNSYLLFLLGE